MDIVDFSLYYMNPYSVPTFLTALGMFGLSIFVVWRERFSQVSLWFLALTLTISGWLFCFSWMYCAVDPSIALDWVKIAYLGVPLIPVFVFLFTVEVLRLYSRYKYGCWLNAAIGVVFVFLATRTTYLISGIRQFEWGFYPQMSWTALPYLAFFIGNLAASLWLYLREYRNGIPGTPSHQRIKMLMIAFSVAYLGALDYLPKFGLHFYPIGYLPVLFFLVLAGVTILKYRLVDITPKFALQEILNNMAETLLVLDMDGRVCVVNRTACELFQGEESDLLGRQIDALTPRPLTKEQFQTAFKTGGIRYYEVTFSQPFGSPRIYSLFASVMRDIYGQPVGMVCLLRDITDRKLSEMEILQLNISLEKKVAERTTELQKVNQDLEAFSFSVSHDLKRPLTLISGFADLLRISEASHLGEEGRKYLQLIQRHALKMGRLIEALLEFSRLGRQEVKRNWVDMNQLVKEVYADLRLLSPERKVEFQAGKLGRAWGDADMLRVVWTNLISNALKYTKRQPLSRIEVGSRGDKNQVVYFVRDNGVGFDEKLAGKLFQVFQRLHSDEEFEGTGVGLAMVLRVVERHGGRVWAEGRPHAGAQFYFSLPESSVQEKVA